MGTLNIVFLLCDSFHSEEFSPGTHNTLGPKTFVCLNGPSQPPPFSMPSKLLILHGEVKSECFTIRCVPESTFNYF